VDLISSANMRKIVLLIETWSSNNFDARWPFTFNAITESFGLREFALSARQFAWANRKENPT
jgi:hypothetical protein